MKKLRKEDEVIVITGKDKGSRGVIDSLVGSNKVIIEGVNIAKKHIKANPNTNTAGGIVDKNMPIDISNIAIFNAETKKADRVGIRINSEDKKERFYKSNGKTIGE